MSRSYSASGVNRPERIVFYDGSCALCHQLIRFLLKHDTQHRLCFAPLNGTTAQQYLTTWLSADNDTLYFWQDGNVTMQSTAILQIGLAMGGSLGCLARLGMLIPRRCRDVGYRLIARNRQNWFGKCTYCCLPSPRQRLQLLD